MIVGTLCTFETMMLQEEANLALAATTFEKINAASTSAILQIM